MTIAPCPNHPRLSWLPCRNCGGLGFTIVVPAEGRRALQVRASALTLRDKLSGAAR